MPIQSVGVVHLVWLPYGIEVFQNFVQSYKAHQAGYAHNLIILFNGCKNKSEASAFEEYIIANQIVYTACYLSEGQDIKAYHYVAAMLSHSHIAVLNSYAVILADNWLLHLVRAISQNNAGAAGATGSWQSNYSSVFVINSFKYDTQKSLRDNIGKYKLLIKAFFYWRLLFKPFPNPHIRTNSFIIQRQLFLECYKKEVKTKFEAYIFESGRTGLSGRLLKKGLDLLVVDKNGNTYKPDEWKKSETFWIGEQRNLLVSDNQTRLYDNESENERKKRTYLAWGKI